MEQFVDCRRAGLIVIDNGYAIYSAAGVKF